jgi:hypothetical protein
MGIHDQVSCSVFVRHVGPLVLFFMLMSTMSLLAQQTATLSGTLTDSTGALVEGASVTLRNTGSNEIRRSLTDATGRYTFTLLRAGIFEVTGDKAGFKESTRPNETSGLITGEQVRNLPLNGRSYDELITLNPGSLNYSSQRTGGVGTSNSAVGNMFAISGRRPQENLFLLDGVEYTGASGLNQTPGGTSGLLLGVDSLREFNVLTNTYSAAYGKRPGAQVLLVANSGTNQFHGSVYEYLRNSAMDARNFFDQGAIPEFQRNQFGARLGGPLYRNHSFLFGNYEGFRQHLDLSDVTLVPDNNARMGYLPGADGSLQHVGVAPGVAPLLALWPVANGPELGNGIAEAFSHPQQKIREDFGTARLDQLLSKHDSLAVTYLIDDSDDVTPTANPNSLDTESLREQVLSSRETHVFSPNLVNLVTIGYSRAHFFFTSEATVNAPSFIAGRPVGVVTVGGSATPNTSSSITSAGTNTGANHYSIRNLFTESDTISYVRGRQSISVGAWFQRVQFNDDLALSQYGQAAFSSLQSFLQGVVSTFTAVPSPTPLDWRSLESAAFVQDEIRFSPSSPCRWVSAMKERLDGMRPMAVPPPLSLVQMERWRRIRAFRPLLSR